MATCFFGSFLLRSAEPIPLQTLLAVAHDVGLALTQSSVTLTLLILPPPVILPYNRLCENYNFFSKIVSERYIAKKILANKAAAPR